MNYMLIMVERQVRGSERTAKSEPQAGLNAKAKNCRGHAASRHSNEIGYGVTHGHFRF